jgi:flagellar hook protein FlgE
MSLNSTLYTGLSGMNVNQTKLNVVGNNIANVNTVAFKGSRALFKPQFYVTEAAGGPPGSDFGGANPSQRGLGAVVSTIEKNFDSGTIETTGKSTDMAVDGAGFFIVKGVDQVFTRDGSFVLNSSNQLVTAQGQFVQGFGVDDNGNIITGSLQNVEIPIGSLTQAKATSRVKFEGNLNAAGQVAGGATILNSQALTTSASTAPDGTTPLTDLRNPSDLLTPLINAGDTLTLSATRGGRDLTDLTYTVQPGDTLSTMLQFFNQGLAIDTSVPTLPGTTPPGATVAPIAGDPAGTARIIIAGNYGTDNALSLAGNGFTSSASVAPFSFVEGTDATGLIRSNPSGESVFTSFEAYDSLGTPLTVNVTAVLEQKADTGNTWRFYATSPNDTDAATFDPVGNPTGNGLLVGTGTLTFDNNGKLLSVTGNSLTISRSNTGAATPIAVEIDFSSMNSLTDSDSVLTMTEQDGFPIGTLNGFSVGPNGYITGTFSNGQTRTLGQIALANFDNPAGLIDLGGNQYMTGPNSGLPVITGPQQLGAGSIRAAALEASNVDLSEEFINLIIASTGFSASSRVITTADRLMTELLQAGR